MRSHLGIKWTHMNAPRTRSYVSAVREGAVCANNSTLKELISAGEARLCKSLLQNSVSAAETVNIHQL